jgi:hypothetical protein
MPKKKKEIKWRSSRAKELLLDDIKNNIISDGIEAEIVFGMHLEYQEFEFKNFKINLKNLLDFVEKSRDRADDDKEAVEHDMMLPAFRQAEWHGSDAERLLSEDVKNHMFDEGCPSIFWLTRPEYQQFSLEKFRKHLFQARRLKNSTYWLSKKGKKKGIKKEKEKEIIISEL